MSTPIPSTQSQTREGYGIILGLDLGEVPTREGARQLLFVNSGVAVMAGEVQTFCPSHWLDLRHLPRPSRGKHVRYWLDVAPPASPTDLWSPVWASMSERWTDTRVPDLGQRERSWPLTGQEPCGQSETPDTIRVARIHLDWQGHVVAWGDCRPMAAQVAEVQQ